MQKKKKIPYYALKGKRDYMEHAYRKSTVPKYKSGLVKT